MNRAEKTTESLTLRDTLRGCAAGRIAASLADATVTLFEAGGKRVLDAGVRDAIAEGVTSWAGKALEREAPMVGEALAKQVGTGVRRLASGTAKVATNAVTRQATRTALKSVASGVAKGAAFGGVIDGAFGAYESVNAYRRREMSARTAVVHTVAEAGKGGVASAAGVAVAAAGVAMLGPAVAVSATMFVVAVGVSIGAKHALDHLWVTRSANSGHDDVRDQPEGDTSPTSEEAGVLAAA